MKGFACVTFLLLLSASSLPAQVVDLTGTWSGTMNVTDTWGLDSPGPCANGTPAPISGSGSSTLVIVQNGSSFNGSVIVPIDWSDHRDANGNCMWVVDSMQSATVAGTVSGSTITASATSPSGRTVPLAMSVSGSTITGSFHGDVTSGAFVFTRQAAPSTGACSLQASIICPTNLGAGASGTCTATMLNAGNGTCSGEIITGFFAPDLVAGGATFSDFTNSLGLVGTCLDSSQFPSADTEPFAYCFGTAALGSNQSFTMSVNVATGAGAPANLSIDAFTEFFDSSDSSLIAVGFASSTLTTPTCTPIAQVASATQSGLAYDVSWSPTTNPTTTYEVDESTASDFSANVNVQTVSGLSRTFTHIVSSATTFYYRVRATNCGGALGPFSPVVSIVVQAPAPPVTKAADTVVPIGSTTPVVVATIFIPGSTSGKGALDAGFTAVVDQPFLTVTPSSGTIPPNGTTVTVTANPTNLPVGANTGTVKITNTTTNGTQNVPVSVSVVTPVSNQAGSAPPPNALIIPVVTHVNGATAPFQSDVRLTNTGLSSVTYRVTFTPTRTNGSVSKVTDITVVSQQTVALNDVAKDFFGFGATGSVSDVGFGSLAIRPLNTAALTNYASSRTYATRPDGGTLGQFVPAIPFSAFATRASAVSLPGMPATPGDIPVLSMQQVSQSPKFRTNLGLVEGSGVAASGKIKVYNDNGDLLESSGYTLQPFEHQQFGLAERLPAMATLSDGRVEITVESAAGAVEAYASVLDNITTDPLAVTPVQVSKIHASRYVLPGVAEFNSGTNFHSDIRIYNGGPSDAVVRMTYYPLANLAGMLTGDPVPAAPITIRSGQVKAIDNVLPTAFNLTTGGGSLVATTDTPSSLVLTERTYSNASSGGTFGQFIPGVSPDQGVALGDRPLQILQLEQSAAFRTNVGIVELTGNPVTVRLSLSVPSTKVSPLKDIQLPGNGFVQIPIALITSLLSTTSDTFNARISVQVISGTGRVTAYGSVIDNTTADPTYVPAQ